MAWLHGVYFLDERRGWAVGSKGTLLHTDDGGQTWQAASRPTRDTLRDVYFVDEQTGWLVCERSIYELYTKTDARSYLLQTTDGGRSWSRVEAAGADVDVLLLRVVFAGERHGWAFGEGGALYVTHDGGATWSRQRVPTPHLLLGAEFFDGGRGWLAGANATLLSTANGGEQWQARPLPVELGRARLNAVEFVTERRGWAVGNGGLILSTPDGGRTWQRQSAGVEIDADLNDVKFLNEQEGWAIGAGGTILHTIDGGASWEAEKSPTRHPLERLALAGASRAWAVGFGGTIVAQTAAVAPPRLSGPPVTRKRRVAAQ